VIYLVDNSLDGQGESPRDIRAALARLVPAIPVVTDRYTEVSPRRVAELAPSHIVLSGQPSPWDLYAAADLAGVFEVIRTDDRPILGICGGLQQIALAYGAPVGLIERIAPGVGYEGARRIRGFFDVELGTRDGLFAGLGSTVGVWESHCDEVKSVPDDFELVASSRECRIEAVRHRVRRLFGVQFHPELFDADHPAGQTILDNFLAL